MTLMTKDEIYELMESCYSKGFTDYEFGIYDFEGDCFAEIAELELSFEPLMPLSSPYKPPQSVPE